jgi:hypothetical protein
MHCFAPLEVEHNLIAVKGKERLRHKMKRNYPDNFERTKINPRRALPDIVE